LANIALIDLNKELGKYIEEFVDTYEKELTVTLDNTMGMIARDFGDKLYWPTPISKGDGGKYGHLRDNITISGKHKDGKKSFLVHFGKKGWLSTLMEYGWHARNGKLVKREPFIRPTFEKNKELYVRWIKEEVQRQMGG
jgi:hypothetical protein